MPKTKISEFSATPANNTDIDSINIAEGCAPSGINDAIRELMAQLKDFQIGSQGDSFNGPIGTSTAAAGAFTTLAASGALTLSGGTASGVTYLNGSKVLTSGSALTFDGTNFGVGGAPLSVSTYVTQKITAGAGGAILQLADGTIDLRAQINVGGGVGYFGTYTTATPLAFTVGGTEGMRLTSTGLGIGTSSPAYKLDVNGTIAVPNLFDNSGSVRFKYSAVNAASRDWRIVSDIANYGDFGIQQSTTQGGSTFDTKLMFSSTGNLGLGVTPSAWGSSYKALQIPAGSISAFSTSQLGINQNAYDTGVGTFVYVNTATASRYLQLNGQHQFYTAASGTAGNAISFTQAMTLDASGNLGVGTTSPATYGKFVVQSSGNAIIARSGNASFCEINVQTGASDDIKGQFQAILGTANKVIIGSRTNHPLAFNIFDTEIARFDTSGNLLVGTTTTASGVSIFPSFSSAGASGIDVKHVSGSASGTYYETFQYNNSLIGYISQNGTTAVAYNTTSDYRLKENIAPMTGALAKVALLKPVTYKWNADGSDGEGFIAHELAEVVPQCVTGEKDAVDENGNPKYQGIDTSFLVATLTAALQELNAKFEAYVASHP